MGLVNFPSLVGIEQKFSLGPRADTSSRPTGRVYISREFVSVSLTVKDT